jgi:uncharacterized protein involved in exopolysaccharide biosynthesis
MIFTYNMQNNKLKEWYMPSESFSPRRYFEKIIHLWWVMFLAIAIGGAAGAGLSYLIPPRYEAQAKISTSIDYTILPELEDYEEDRIINEAGAVMLSDAVLLDVQERTKTEGVRIPFEDFSTRFSADRIDDLWALRVVGADQQEASSLANIWVDISFQHLTSAHAYALEASAIRSALAALEDCQQADDSTAPALCETTDVDTLEKELDAMTAELEEALALSLGLNPASNYTINSYAVVPLSPSYRARGVMAFLGMLLGLMAGLVALWFIGKKE